MICRRAKSAKSPKSFVIHKGCIQVGKFFINVLANSGQYKVATVQLLMKIYDRITKIIYWFPNNVFYARAVQ